MNDKSEAEAQKKKRLHYKNINLLFAKEQILFSPVCLYNIFYSIVEKIFLTI